MVKGNALRMVKMMSGWLRLNGRKPANRNHLGLYEEFILKARLMRYQLPVLKMQGPHVNQGFGKHKQGSGKAEIDLK